MDEQIRPVNRARAPAVSRPVPKARTSARGPIMNMTANRMILLLQIYRSPDWATERRIGTFESDLQMLLLSGFIHITSGRIYETTDRGDAYIKQLLEIEP